MAETSNTTGQPEGENDWFFDIIITFLRSPRWKTPIMSFLDENCIIFDNDDENKLEYTQIHNDFKKIVDDLLCELMAELDITQDQFLEACDKASQNQVHKKVVDQITAVDNFMAFKKLMIKRNTELNEEALKMMLQKEQKQIQLHLAEAALKQEQEQQIIAQPHPTPDTISPGVKVTETGSKIYQAVDLEELRREQEEYELALQVSMAFEEERKHEYNEEEEMVRMAMEMSIKEENERLEKQKQEQEEQQKALQKIEKESIQEAARIKQKEEIIQQNEQKVIQESQNVQLAEPYIEQIPQQVIQEEEKKELPAPKKQKAPAPGFQGYNLPPVALKKGGGVFDPNLLKEQQDSILKGFNQMDEELNILEQNANKKKDPFENKPMSEVLKEKRQETEKILESTKVNQQESMEERRLRLRAHRDMLLKMKKDQRQQELDDFNDKTKGNKQDLHKELLEIDSKIKAKDQIQKHFEENFGDIENLEGTEYDKRLMMYKNLREQVLLEMSTSSKADQKAKMEEINKKITALEKAKKEKDQRELLAKQALEQKRFDKQKGFLDGIQSFAVEDI